MDCDLEQAPTKTILIVEDDVLTMKLFSDLLHVFDYEIIQSLDGKKVLEIASEQSPDLIVMDIRLPECCGYELIKLLKSDECLKHIPIVAVTAYAMQGDKEAILEAGCNDYIAKPILISAFLEVVAKHLS